MSILEKAFIFLNTYKYRRERMYYSRLQIVEWFQYVQNKNKNCSARSLSRKLVDEFYFTFIVSFKTV